MLDCIRIKASWVRVGYFWLGLLILVYVRMMAKLG
jgi:hypothetical protein